MGDHAPDLLLHVPSVICNGWNSEFSGINHTSLPSINKRLSVRSPLTTAITIDPDCASSERSTISISPSCIPALIIENPFTRTKNVAAGWRTNCLFRSMVASRWSSAGDGKPAGIFDPNSGKSTKVGNGFNLRIGNCKWSDVSTTRSWWVTDCCCLSGIEALFMAFIGCLEWVQDSTPKTAIVLY